MKSNGNEIKYERSEVERKIDLVFLECSKNLTQATAICFECVNASSYPVSYSIQTGASNSIN